MTSRIAAIAACIGLVAPGMAAAWGDVGHEVTAHIAYRHLTPAAKRRIDALLAADSDPLTAPDFAARATWADKYRKHHRETTFWHFVDVEIDRPDLRSACFGFPALPAARVASAGPARDCIVDKIVQFQEELHDPLTAPAERIMALKFLMHFVGDLHQPLHASDHYDRGGNCVRVAPSWNGRDANLHAYWDTTVVEALGPTAQAIADRLDEQITSGEKSAWSRGEVGAWAMESFELSRNDVYALPSRPTCGDETVVWLTPAYAANARKDAALQLERAGIRLAVLLNRAFGPE